MPLFSGWGLFPVRVQSFLYRDLHEFRLPAQQTPTSHNLIGGPGPASCYGLEGGSGGQSPWGDLQFLGDLRALAA